ncbi:MAG: hypothetical protein RLZZ422_1491 [Pseudomonadota bacterium]|jgi:hypothetical protein
MSQLDLFKPAYQIPEPKPIVKKASPGFVFGVKSIDNTWEEHESGLMARIIPNWQSWDFEVTNGSYSIKLSFEKSMFPTFVKVFDVALPEFELLEECSHD